MILGTSAVVRFSRIVDGDTIRVFLPDRETDESVRILSIDTEESNAGGTKPRTPWGLEAKARADRFFRGAESVTIEFPGNESFADCLLRYRGNYGRLLVYVYRDGIDFQETMIREGYSPYFNKYGNADFGERHQRYVEAERHAQSERLGVWDQILVNGSEMRNYAALGVWWNLRAAVIDDYRALSAKDPSVLNTRLDYDEILTLSGSGSRATLFTEINSIRRVGGDSGLIGIGSMEQPFSCFIPDLDSPEGQAIARLLESRYISSGEIHPRRSYAFVTGTLSRYNGKPQIVLTSINQISDTFPQERADTGEARVAIQSALPNPEGDDRGNEKVTLSNKGAVEVDLVGWALVDRSGNRLFLDGVIGVGEELALPIGGGELPLDNSGDELSLLDSNGRLVHRVSYTSADAKSGKTVEF